MSSISLIRIASFLITAGFAMTCGSQFAVVVSVLALVHYAVAIVYSRRQVVNAVSRPLPALLTGALALSSAGLFWSHFRLSLVFLPHHVLNEVYLSKKELFAKFERETKWLVFVSILLNSAIYCAVCGLTQHFPIYSAGFTIPLLLVAVPAFIYSLFKLRRTLPATKLLDACVLELLGVLALAVGNLHPITIWHIVMYHITFWAIYPLAKMWQPGRLSPSMNYVLLNLVLIVAVSAISPHSPSPWRMGVKQLSDIFYFLSFLHIMLSFAISKAQPDWMWKFFQPATGRVSLATESSQPALVASGK